LTAACYSCDHERTGFIGQLLHRDALKWYKSLVRVSYEALYEYDTFLSEFTASFQDPNYQTKVNSKILRIRQDRTPISRYIIQFRCLVSDVEHSESYLIELFMLSLHPELLTQLSYLGEPSSLEESFQLAIIADKQMFRHNAYSRTPEKPKGKN
jgi:hypothetical protein